MADAAAAFMLDGTPAVGTGAAVVGVNHIYFFVVNHVHLDRFGNGISTGSDAVFSKTRRFVAGDADHLFHCLACLYA
jgi:hypothetical protein